ncbi:MAG TPA: rhodanese-like domain-containing protein, partial [Methanoregulaceae archaeon]|nr:rhodanese-like domain-containing protein [Methanoregulaceae archaeon]
MFFETVRSEGLAHQSYIVGAGGRAAVIDPRRDCGIYLRRAVAHGAVITHIFETHRNEDYVTGSAELARRTGATVYHGAATPFAFGSPARHGDRFQVGPLEIVALETPGHTDESLSFALYEPSVPGRPVMVFSGDALFAGSVGRVDLAGDDPVANAHRLHDSLHRVLLPLGDGTIVCPAHGSGSVCGPSISDLPFTTIGIERRSNPYLRLGREEFVERKAGERGYRAPYFREMERVNLVGSPAPPDPCTLRRLSPGDLDGMQVVDIRSPTAFAAGHVPGSINIWREGLPLFIGWTLDYDRPIALVDDFNQELHLAAAHFVRLGFDNLTGFLDGGFMAWLREARPVGRIETWTVQDLFSRLDGVTVLDVRDIANRKERGAIPGSMHVYAGEVAARIDEVPHDRPV